MTRFGLKCATVRPGASLLLNCIYLLCLLAVIPAADGARAPSASVSEELIRRNVEKKVVSLSGQLEPYEKIALHARITGYLKSIPVDLGDRVKKGEVVAEPAVPETEAEAAMAKARLAEMQAQSRQAEMVYRFKARISDRLHALHKRLTGAVTEDELDVADGERVAAGAERAIRKAAVDVARAKLENINALLSFAHITAPFDGIVTRRVLHTGALVAAGKSGGKPVVNLARIDRLRLVIDIPERIAPYLRLGDKLRVRFPALPGETFDATISRMGGVLAADNGLMRAEADVEPRAGLHPGMRAIVAIHLW